MASRFSRVTLGVASVTAGESLDNGFIGHSRGGYPMYSEYGGRTIYRPHMTIRTGRDAAAHYTPTPD